MTDIVGIEVGCGVMGPSAMRTELERVVQADLGAECFEDVQGERLEQFMD